MNSNVVRLIVLGLAGYALFAFLVLSVYPDKPEDMDWEDRQDYNKVQITKLRLGTTLDEVVALMGSPDITEAKIIGEEQIQVMFYRTHHVKGDGLTTMDECTALLFENNKLIAWGEGAYQSYLNG